MKLKLSLLALPVTVGSILTTITATAATWTGGSGGWSNNATPGWNGTGVPNAIGATAAYTSSGTSTVAIVQNTAPNVTVGSILYTGSTAMGWNFTLSAPITLNQDSAGSGFATISNANTSASTANALGFGAGTMTLADDLLISNTGGSTNTTGAIQISSTIGGTGNITLSNASTNVTQAGSIRIQTATNTFTGSVLVQKGTTTFNNAAVFGNSSNEVTLGQSGQGSAALLTTSGGSFANPIIVAAGSGGTLTLGRSGTGTSTFSGSVTLNGNLSIYSETTNTTGFLFSNTLSGAGSLTQAGAGILALSGANTFTGDTILSTGTLKINNDLALQNSALDTSGAGLINATTTSLTFGGLKGSTNLASVITTGYTSLTGLTLNPGVGATPSYSGIIADGSAGMTLTKSGAGIQTLSGANSYTGSTIISNGTLQLSIGSNRLPIGTVVSIGQSASANLGTLDLNGQNQEIAGLQSISGTNAGVSTNVVTSATSSTLKINCSTSTSYTYGSATAANSGVISGAISVDKSGTGTQIFGGNNSYSGTTTVNLGTLMIEGAQSGNGTVTVGSSGKLGGDGSIAGSLVFNTGADFVFSTTKTFTVNGASVSFGGLSISDLFGLDSTVAVGVYTLIDGSASIDFTNVSNLDFANAFDLGDGKSAYFQLGSLQVVVIPEANVAALFGGFGVLGLLRRRR